MFRRVFEKQKPLIIISVAHLLLFIVLAIISTFDSQEILGINRWIKPMKFASSITIYLFTLAIYLYFINGKELGKKIIAYGAIAMMVGEIALIVMQAARGTTSHFNVSSAFNGIVFSAMGTMIVINTFLVIYLLFLYLKADIDLPKSILWGMRFGIILLILASAEGGLMTRLFSHSVGVADGSAGLPFLNWSTRGGDLRAAHFFGMHAFQAVPLFAYTLERYRIKSSTLWTSVFALVYCLIFTGVFVQALLGKPLFSMFY